jgi:hypothetical protein
MLHESIPGFATIGKNRNAKRKHENLENRFEILRLLEIRSIHSTLYTLYDRTQQLRNQPYRQSHEEFVVWSINNNII